ncbi:hypothetical protein [Mechercharimyces sp. CAU 1602]|uniref:hypothetical protein n=1 Tax=Mechercharimyces sp. CAU 1602 TaxID=2973933 RepID=UPI002162896D|nr:hypothetical protein [Mechercharimyces sp. CAU 1602]MCS1352037.1 hypothetical protein [Mechercharimyces sp. CAU 1602]
MIFFDRMVVVHESFGAPRVIYSLRNQLERHNIYSELKVSRKRQIATYQLLVPKRDEKHALQLLSQYKEALHE